MMGIKAVLFDLDGTLLPMDMDKFIEAYFGGLVKKLVPLGYEPKSVVNGVWKGTDAMISNNGDNTNDVVFWNTFCELLGEECRKDEAVFEEFYKNEFQEVKNVCGFDKNAAKVVYALKANDIKVAVATSPIFPAIATESRIKWAGLSTEDFEFYTTYENCRYTKPNIKYYEEVAKKIGVKPEECLMVGNDVDDDMVAENIGMKVFLLTDNLINKNDVDISKYPNGGYQEFIKYLKTANLI